ncbi:serine hydrolase [uncultured Caulobacter sp.]|uniref:serine hydrolase domain-containing protein n=1 Tax=uncultured Caulobacter sp. TaxID=158749 RepID=UPI002615AE3F|nr:serine hydrolase domain-containing protein [uncultured Caulobacter sp.]
MSGIAEHSRWERRRRLKWLAVGAVGVVLVGGVFAITQTKSVPKVVASAVQQVTQPVPDKPSDWHGDIDYAALDARLREMMTDRSMEGLAVAVVDHGRLAFVRGYGLTSSDGGQPVDAHTVFRWASLSKTVSATLSARLAANGAFSLTEPLADFHTSLRLPGDAQNTLTVEDLLAHRTGLGKNAYDGQLEDGVDPARIRSSLGTLKPVCPPGTCHSYQNVAYDTITEIIGARTGQPYAETVESKLFEPLGMTGASIGQAGLTSAARWAKPHDRNRRPLKLSEAYYRVPGAAGVNSTILDLAAWMRAQMGLMPRVLPADVLDAVQRPRVATGRPYGRLNIARELKDPAYGLGMRSFTYRGHRLIGHSGGVSGYRSTMMFDPATKTGIVMLWNSDGNLPFRFQGEFFDRVYKLPFTDFLDLKASERAGEESLSD